MTSLTYLLNWSVPFIPVLAAELNTSYQPQRLKGAVPLFDRLARHSSLYITAQPPQLTESTLRISSLM